VRSYNHLIFREGRSEGRRTDPHICGIRKTCPKCDWSFRCLVIDPDPLEEFMCGACKSKFDASVATVK